MSVEARKPKYQWRVFLSSQGRLQDDLNRVERLGWEIFQVVTYENEWAQIIYRAEIEVGENDG